MHIHTRARSRSRDPAYQRGKKVVGLVAFFIVESSCKILPEPRKSDDGDEANNFEEEPLSKKWLDSKEAVRADGGVGRNSKGLPPPPMPDTVVDVDATAGDRTTSEKEAISAGGERISSSLLNQCKEEDERCD